MKKLTLKHTMKVAKIIKKGNLKKEITQLMEQFKEEFQGKEEKVNLEQVGMEVILTVVEACGNDEVEKELYSLLGDIFESNTVEEMTLETLIENFKTLAAENNLIAFFKSASQ